MRGCLCAIWCDRRPSWAGHCGCRGSQEQGQLRCSRQKRWTTMCRTAICQNRNALAPYAPPLHHPALQKMKNNEGKPMRNQWMPRHSKVRCSGQKRWTTLWRTSISFSFWYRQPRYLSAAVLARFFFGRVRSRVKFFVFVFCKLEGSIT